MKVKIEFETNNCQNCMFFDCDDYEYKCSYSNEYLEGSEQYDKDSNPLFDPDKEIHKHCPFKEDVIPTRSGIKPSIE